MWGASVFALPGAGKRVMQKGLALTFTFVLIGCGGALSGGPSSSPSATPNQFVVSGNFTGLKCTSSSAPVEFLALDESATTISIKFEGPGANGIQTPHGRSAVRVLALGILPHQRLRQAIQGIQLEAIVRCATRFEKLSVDHWRTP